MRVLFDKFGTNQECMFEKTLRELRQLKSVQKISIPILPDKDGYIDKECPDKNCMFQFKVHGEDWANNFQDEKVFCPMCRHEANSQSWFTTEQIEEGKKKVHAHIVGRINNALYQDSRNFNSMKSPNSFLKLSMRFSGKHGLSHVLSLEAKEEMELKVQCRECSAKYAVIGSAFFCPCCGHNSVEETFLNAVNKIEIKINKLDSIKESLLSTLGKDNAETICRSLVETALNDCVVAFQRFNELSFSKKAPAIKVHFNAFQNLEAGEGYWRQVIGESYSDWITENELSEIKVYFQQRHLLSHTEGMIDQKYIDKSGDNTYKVGQRVVVKKQDVKDCLRIIVKIVDKLKDKL